MRGRSVRLVFPARAEYVILARLTLAGIARAVPIEDETLADLKLAVTEACGNVVKHAYTGDEAQAVVRVVFAVEHDAIAVTVEDDGVGLPPGRDDATSTDGTPEHGMGLSIIGALATDVKLRPAGRNGGTRLSFRKRLTALPADA